MIHHANFIYLFFWQHTFLKLNLSSIHFSYINISNPEYTVSGMFLLLVHPLNLFFFSQLGSLFFMFHSLPIMLPSSQTWIVNQPCVFQLCQSGLIKMIWPFQAGCFGLWGISPLKVETEASELRLAECYLSCAQRLLRLECKSRLKERLVCLTSSMQNKEHGGQASAHISNYVVFFFIISIIDHIEVTSDLLTI